MGWRISFVAVAVALIFSAIGSSAGTLNFTFDLQGGLWVNVAMSTPVPGGSFHGQTQGQDLVWTNNLYQVRITPRSEKGITYLRLHMESRARHPVVITSLTLQVRVPSKGLAGVWTPSGRLDSDTFISADAATPFVTSSAANYGIPYIAAADAFGNNALAIGLLDQDLPVEIRATPLAIGFSELSLNAAFSVNGRGLDRDFFISNDKSYSWYGAAEEYAGWVDTEMKHSAFPISSRAYEAVYDTWYWSQDNVDDALYLQTAQAASEADLGMFLADSGWDAPAGEYDKWLAGRTGDYLPPAGKFRDLRETFGVLRSQFDLQVQLWLQPFAIGRNSARYAPTRPMHVQIVKTPGSASFAPFSLPLTGSNNLEDVNLCPRLWATSQYLKYLFTEMSRTYRPDAYWLDFIDGIPAYCVAPHLHDFATFGEGLRQALGTIRDTILSLERDPVVQFRAQYANLHNKPYANVWQPFDSPNNFERMRLDALRLRPFSKGVVFASDQLYWPSDADDETVARFVMASVMSGVPSIGANLLELRPSALEIVKNWMGFYRKYRPDLTAGRFRPFGSFRKPNHKIETNGRLFAYIRSNGRVVLTGARKKEIFLLNASEESRIRAVVSVFPERTYELQAFDRYLQPWGAATSTRGDNRGILEIEAVVEPGGFLELRTGTTAPK